MEFTKAVPELWFGAVNTWYSIVGLDSSSIVGPPKEGAQYNANRGVSPDSGNPRMYVRSGRGALFSRTSA